MLPVQVNLNGSKLNYFSDIKPALAESLTLILQPADYKYAPLEAIKENTFGIFQIARVICNQEDLEGKVHGSEKANLTRLVHDLTSREKDWGLIQDKDEFTKKVYDFALSLDGFGGVREYGWIATSKINKKWNS